jgi:hypothetical protein
MPERLLAPDFGEEEREGGAAEGGGALQSAGAPRGGASLRALLACEDVAALLGVARVTPRAIADALPALLPPSWRGAPLIARWDPPPAAGGALGPARAAGAAGGGFATRGILIRGGVSGAQAQQQQQQPTAEWLGALWRELPFEDPETIDALREWPLVPLLPATEAEGAAADGSAAQAPLRLLSCGLARHALVVWSGAFDGALAARLDAGLAAAEAEARAAGLAAGGSAAAAAPAPPPSHPATAGEGTVFVPPPT